MSAIRESVVPITCADLRWSFGVRPDDGSSAGRGPVGNRFLGTDGCVYDQPATLRSYAEDRIVVTQAVGAHRRRGGSSLTLDHITQVFEKDGEPLVAVKDVSLKVRQGEFLTLVGPSGCGKSTLLKIVAGLLSPTSGSVYLGHSPVVEPREEIGLMFQTSTLFPWRNVIRKHLPAARDHRHHGSGGGTGGSRT